MFGSDSLHPRFTLLLPLGLLACQAQWSAEDVDGDGYSIADGDCWDRVQGPDGSGLSGAQIHPDAAETWYDGYDQDCGQDEDYDADGDGYVLDAFVGATTYGVGGTGGLPGGDCWDDPGAIPDGFAAVETFPQLTAGQVNPGVAADTWYDGIDQDCAGDSDFDQDGDGFDSEGHPRADGTAGEDCDDAVVAVNPDAVEICDDLDNNCNGLVDGADPDVDPDSIRTWYEDQDEDGYGADAELLEACDQPEGYVETPGDCADEDEARNPDADEVCNELDDDCNGNVDEAAVDAPTWWLDADLDGYGDVDEAVASCDAPAGYADNADDCADMDPAVNPDADELCSTAGVDDDCDGAVDENDAADAPTWYSDLDSDGYGLSSLTTQACAEPTGFAADAGDCDDTDPARNPGADELCSTVGVDDDCDGSADEDDAADASPWYADADGDGYGDPLGESGTACAPPSGAVANDCDCDDDCDTCWTDAPEQCNDYLDNDCDGTANTCAIDAVVDLASATIVVQGEGTGDDLALALDSGDLDGDGQPDLLLGARNAGGGGKAYLLAGPLTGTVGAASAELVLVAEDADDKAGRAVALVDLDGDDYDDAVVSATAGGSGSSKGVVYVVYGPASGTVDLGAADWRVEGGSSWLYLGLYLRSLGDLDGDGLPDLGVGTTYADEGGTNAGAIYLWSGPGTGAAASEADADWTITGDDGGDGFGRSFAAAGDVDGDGVDDLLAGAHQDDTGAASAGAAYLFLGPLAGDASAADADAAWWGESSYDAAGDAVAAGGDLDGDGRPDLVIGAYVQGSDDAGAAYVVLGAASPTSGSLGDAAVVLRGEDVDQQLGVSVAVLGDLDMDGRDDLAIGDGGRDACSASSGFGHTYLFYGALAGDYTSADADSVIVGADEGDCAGAQVDAPGDLTGDGYPDLAVGAPGAAGTGAAYVIEGVGM